MSDLVAGSDGALRCSWHGGDPLYEAYHDAEWGRPVLSDVGLFERIALEGFQAGLSWITILRKREAFRRAFSAFDLATVAAFGEGDVARLLDDAGIVRNAAKIRATVGNAQCGLALVEEHGSLAAFLSGFVGPRSDGPRSFADLPAVTDDSARLSKELKARGWSFVGPTTMYALMQAVGLVNDHLVGCFVRDECAVEQAAGWGSDGG